MKYNFRLVSSMLSFTSDKSLYVAAIISRFEL